MVQIRSRLDVADNTGARMATMIGVIGKATLYAGIGDIITANVKEASATGTVKKGEVVRAVLVRTRQPIRRDDGSLRTFTTMWVVRLGESLYVRSAGGSDRPWYRHVVYAPGLLTGYDVKTLPGIREAIEGKDFARAAQQSQVLLHALERMAGALTGAARQD